MSKPKTPTTYPGVRYREHESRKHGIRYDRYFFIRYKVDGKDKEEGVGWASSGMTAEKASKLLGEIRENIRTGDGPKSLAEMREQEAEKGRELAKKLEAEKTLNTDFVTFFNTEYLPSVEFTKSCYSIKKEKELYKNWIDNIIGKLSFKEINIKHIEYVVQTMANKSKSKRTIQYALSVISQVWNYAKIRGIVMEDSPTKQMKIGKLDNERRRFLTEDEARLLLDELGKHSIDLKHMAMLALFCGLRASEIFKLSWEDIDIENGTILLRSTKSGRSRYAFMTKEIKQIVLERQSNMSDKEAFIFPTQEGKQHQEISKTFSIIVNLLGLNNGVTDNKNKVVFHTLRHTFASWLAQKGVPLYSIQQLMGHASFQMVQRYAHLSTESMRDSVKVLNGSLDEPKEDENITAKILKFNTE